MSFGKTYRIAVPAVPHREPVNSGKPNPGMDIRHRRYMQPIEIAALPDSGLRSMRLADIDDALDNCRQMTPDANYAAQRPCMKFRIESKAS